MLHKTVPMMNALMFGNNRSNISKYPIVITQKNTMNLLIYNININIKTPCDLVEI